MNLQQNKLNAKSTSQELKQRLEGIKNFIMQPKCKETFVMKSVIYNYINRFWDGKCFLLRANAKKDMRILFEQDFTKPFKEYIRTNHDKDKDMCIDCGRPMGNKERVSIAFMKDMADDLARKKSAFWNCKVDAFLCPACAFVYAASPLGFTLTARRCRGILSVMETWWSSATSTPALRWHWWEPPQSPPCGRPAGTALYRQNIWQILIRKF